ncbi:acetylcholinesterase isoform X2 [Pectinophora gossypiella]|uniref:acetylcholinesterase isoform X2 n=1 Tax=Pectinophora gossypiella TaxID=13191 RepID=UPI00214EBC61|nr:acetylcholinesterase isoform X2 [Pectinophora gossypiella]
MIKNAFLAVFLCVSVRSQSNKDLYNGQYMNEYYNKQYDGSREMRVPAPGDSDYRTYVYNNRRYGADPTRYNPYNPNINQPGGFPYNPIPYNPLNPSPMDDQYKYNVNRDPNNPDALFPGVLGGWREDLQGKERRDSRQLKRDVFVNTNFGQVQGFKVYLYDNPDPDSGYRPWLTPVERIQGEVSVFLGIPYARPPVLEGRFKPPRQHPGWQLMQAVDWGPACPQPVKFTGATKGIRDMDEDCLYLNVFSPNTEAGATAQKYPVMVYIHGGQFQSGASNLFPAHMLAGFYNVVVVSINYRLGALGFLSTGDENSPGNYGILDQAMALRWIYDNIGPFNGDRNSITLFGPGAGAASAGLLALAPMTSDIVTRVIAQSGSALADWALIEDKFRVQNTSLVFGRLLGCPIDSSWKLVNCLRQGRSFYELGNAQFEPQVGFIPWGPVLENNFTFPGDEWYEGWRQRDWRFLDTPVEDLIKRRRFNPSLRYMTGVTTQEAAYVLYNNDSLAPNYEITERWFNQKVAEFVLRYNYTLNPRGVYEAIRYMYTYHPEPHNVSAIRDQYTHFLSDFLYRAPTDKMVKLLLEQNVPVYMYVLNTTVEAFRWPEWRQYAHDTEHFFLSGAPFMDPEFFPNKLRIERQMWTGNDRNMSHFFMKAFSDFARYGNPTRSRILGVHFEVATAGQLRYLNLNTTYNSTIQLNYRQTELAFWTVYLPTVIGRLVPTYPPITEYWWEPKQPLQIAFWSVSSACLLLIVLLVVLCMLWRNAKRETDRYYSDDIFMVPDLGDPGVDNTTRSRDNIYEYRDVPIKRPQTPQTLSRATSQPQTLQSRPISAASTGSALSLKEGTVSLSPEPVPVPRARSRTQLVHGVPQTTV